MKIMPSVAAARSTQAGTELRTAIMAQVGQAVQTGLAAAGTCIWTALQEMMVHLREQHEISFSSDCVKVQGRVDSFAALQVRTLSTACTEVAEGTVIALQTCCISVKQHRVRLQMH